MEFRTFFFIYAFTWNINMSHGMEVIDLEDGFDNYGVLAAFGDYNSDRLVDVFVISPLGDRIDVILVGRSYDFERQNLYNLSSSDSKDHFISGIMLADFDGDISHDILVCKKQISTSRIALEVVWGNESRPSYNFSGDTFVDEPILFDYNADMLPDLLVEKTPGSWTIYVADVLRGFKPKDPLSRSPLAVPHSSAFISLLEYNATTREYAADLLVTTQDGFEIYRNASKEAAQTYSDVSNSTVFASSFGDFNQDNKVDHIVPACDGDKCTINVYDYTTKKWSTMLTLDGDWVFQPLAYNHFQFMPTLHVGDYDTDGFPDVVTVLSSPTHRDRAFLLMNVECTVPECIEYGRMFDKDQQKMPDYLNSTLSAAFFDIVEDGSLDVVLTAKVTNTTIPELVFLGSDVTADTCFLKVTVVNGRSKGKPSYSLNVPGPMDKYMTTRSFREKVYGAAGQLSQSAHFALQLPYVMFGLGQTPNFVEKVGVGIPNFVQNEVDRYRIWEQIIPNSQLVINPYPLDNPRRWSMKLLVMPSEGIWYVGIALACTCVLVACIVVALHLHEKHEDSKEKKQESQKFHFDAM